MAPLSYFVTIVAVLGLASATSLSDLFAGKEKETDKRDVDTDCIVQGRRYHHGQVFTLGASRCIKYRCAFGNYNFHEEGCDAWGQCRPVHQQFTHKCRDYICNAQQIGSGYMHYKVIPVGSQKCEDYYGQCRHPGEMFVFNMKGAIKRQCTCRPLHDAMSYICYD